MNNVIDRSISAKMRDVLSQEDRKEETIQDSDFIQNIKSTKRNLKKVYKN